MRFSKRHSNQDIIAQTTKVKNHRGRSTNINIPFYSHEDYLTQETDLQLTDRVRFEVVPAGVEDPPRGVDDIACLEAYGCTETWNVTDPDETYNPFDEGVLNEIAKTANPDIESDSELTMTVGGVEKGTDGSVQNVTIDCNVEISGLPVSYKTVLKTEGDGSDYDYVVETNYNKRHTNDYETLGKIKIRSTDSDETNDACGWEVRFSSEVHPEKEFDPDRVPGNENETFKIGEMGDHRSYDRHIKFPSRFHADRSHVYCTRDEEFKRQNDYEDDCTGEHLENPFNGLLEEKNWDTVVIEYNDGGGGNDRWSFRVYMHHPISCPMEILDAGRENRVTGRIGLPTSLAVLEGSQIDLSSIDLEVPKDEEAQWQFSRVAYESAIDRLLTSIETTNNKIVRQVRAKGLRILTEPDNLDMEDSTEAVISVDATARVLDLIDMFDSLKTRAHLTATLENILNPHFCSVVPEEYNETLSENFSSEGGPGLMLRLMERCDYAMIRGQAAKALFNARSGKGKPGPPGKALSEIDGGSRLLSLYREAPDDYFRWLIAKVITLYAKNRNCSEIFIESNIHGEMLNMAENSTAGSPRRFHSILALRHIPLHEPKAMGDIDAPDRLGELLYNSTAENTREKIASTLACFASTNEGRELIVNTDAHKELLQVVVEEELSQKLAAKALNDIISSGHEKAILEADGPRLLLNALEKLEEKEVEDEEEVRENLAEALKKLSRASDPARRAVIEADGLEKLLNMIEYPEENYIKKDIARTLKKILRRSVYGRKKMIKNNEINRLLTTIESQENGSIRQNLTDSLKTLSREDTCKRLFIDANGVKMVLDAIQSSNNPEIQQDLGSILYDHKRDDEWISAIVDSGGSDIVITAFETAVDVNSSTDGEDRLNTYRWATLLEKITDTEAGIRATQSVNGLRRIKKLIRVFEAQKEQTRDEEITQSTLERIQRRLSEPQRSKPSKFTGYVFAGAVVRELLTSDSESTPNKKDTEYSNTVIRGIARVFRALGRIYGRGLDVIRRLR
jgi:hypothetical protein